MMADRAIVFTGHMVDLPDRPTVKRRFPPAMESLAREAIDLRLREIAARGENLLGISAAARGGDILFLEACRQLDVPYLLALPFQPERFLETSVAGAEGNWVERYWRLWRETSPDRKLVMAPVGEDRNPYSEHNLWLLRLAQERARDMTLIALWDGAGGDGPGGTADVVARTRESGGETIVIDSRELLRRLDRGDESLGPPGPP
jgi:hypothetical protein